MINWNSINNDDACVILQCAKRGVNMLGSISLLDLEMDITAAHIANPLRLDALLNADEFNFIHDICGIRENINRKNGEMNNCFLPRFSANDSEPKPQH